LATWPHGIPIVDAGMRQLWATGWMHNRVRMIVASFLVKNLRIHWLQGARWFWDTLVDADLPNNTMNWQWVAGRARTPAPYFRIFNPVTQSAKFDPSGRVRAALGPGVGATRSTAHPCAALQRRRLLHAARVQIGATYPAPMVDLAESRRAALAAYQAL
jgi:deoxyribodipyrimidine photo-lyase